MENAAAETSAEQIGEYLKLGERYGLAPLLLLLGTGLAVFVIWRAGKFLSPLLIKAFGKHGDLIDTLQTNSSTTAEAIAAIRSLFSARGEQLDRVERKLDTIHQHLTGTDPDDRA